MSSPLIFQRVARYNFEPNVADAGCDYHFGRNQVNIWESVLIRSWLRRPDFYLASENHYDEEAD